MARDKYTPEGMSTLPAFLRHEKEENLSDAQFLFKRSLHRDPIHALAVFNYARDQAEEDLLARSQILVHNFLIEETGLRQQEIDSLKSIFVLPS